MWRAEEGELAENEQDAPGMRLRELAAELTGVALLHTVPHANLDGIEAFGKIGSTHGEEAADLDRDRDADMA